MKRTNLSILFCLLSLIPIILIPTLTKGNFLAWYTLLFFYNFPIFLIQLLLTLVINNIGNINIKNISFWLLVVLLIIQFSILWVYVFELS
jgi:hypothetical protein